MRLSELIKILDRIELIGDIDSVEIKGISCDSRRVDPNSVFFAIRGSNYDGNDFIREAISKGAVCIISERRIDWIERGVPLVVVRDVREALGRVSSLFYNRPSLELKLIGITGTNGKTTTSYLTESILKEARLRVGVIGTINHRFGERIYPSLNTTPGPIELQRILREMVDSDISHVIIEVSSHALHQKRVDSCDFDVAVFTNITHDHLDYHRSMEDYFRAKRRLFDELLLNSEKGDKYAVINLDDGFGRRIKDGFRGNIITYGRSREADIRPKNITLNLDGIEGEIVTPAGDIHIKSPLLGEQNLYNILAAIGVAISLGIKEEYMAAGIQSLKHVPGRMERIRSKMGFDVFIDYAHTPDALEKLLLSLKDLVKGRIITLFGCGGSRDRKKRPLMGAIASRYSDIVIITSDNPRDERPEDIIAQIERGMELRRYEETEVLDREVDKGYLSIPDRRRAIERAIGFARAGDAVIIAGKGHEDYQLIGGRRIHFNDRIEVERVLDEAGG